MAVALAIAVTAAPFAAPSATADGTWATAQPAVDTGTVVLVDATDPSTEITHGQSATVFSLRLPEGSACPGDSANDQWRVQSFIVPVTDDPATLIYDEIKPVGDGRWALYDTDTRPYVHIFTEPNSAPGSPGRIAPVLPLSFAVFPPGTLPAGTYRIGLACTHFRATATYWDAEILLADAPEDEPGQLTWRVAGAPPSAGDAGGPGLGWLARGVGIGAAALLVAGAALLLRHRGTRRSASLSKDHA